MKNFIIVTSQRSGSTWFTDLLDSHPQIICSGELYKNNTKIRYPENSYINYCNQDIYRKLKSYLFPKMLTTEHLGWYFSKSSSKSCGFKIMLDQLKDKQFILDKVYKDKHAIIVLMRENIIERMISKKLASQNNLWVTHKKNNQLKSVEINLNTLLNDLSVYQEENDLLEEIIKTYASILIKYNDLKSDTYKELSKVVGSLGVNEFNGFDSKIKKIVKNNFRSLIENYDDFVLAIKGTPYEHYLRD